ncbi:bacillithiol biosynthesis deacetylase BshB1 [Bernardetia sp.]|uniref:bacillithiol biosynthesis deacetylase BshB1 n=1 Tax=Bernardetia sp. TaxID=1937974 RepID=UPI0025B7D936|nr:bacillithiol biosynthesis deacetylase BshB1 [Bernardetia sp.]
MNNKDIKLDILALAAHPDDVELSCSGTLLAAIAQGKKVGIIDFTRGELGSRGSAEIRDMEAKKSGEILGLSVRENLAFRDGFFYDDNEHRMKVIQAIRRFRPEIVLINAPSDRHPDHGKGAELQKTSCFLSGLIKIETEWEGEKQKHWRPKHVYHYIQSNMLPPDFVVDITPFWEQKMKSVMAFESQFHNSNYQSNEEETFISSPRFVQFLEARAKEFGHAIQVDYGEGFIKTAQLGVKDITDLI